MAGVTQTRVLAIDGPAGAGKSSTARALAERLGFFYLDTGAMYRALAVRALRAGLALDDEPALVGMLATLRLRFDAEGRLFVDGEDETAAIRTPEASRAASVIATLAGVRERLVEKQRALAESQGSVVMEGRDIGTVVCPDSPIKIFLEADLVERARRRIRQQDLVPTKDELARVQEAIRARDESDAGRAEAPLRPADDAVRIDTTGLSFDAQVERCMAAVLSRWPAEWGPFPGDPRRP